MLPLAASQTGPPAGGLARWEPLADHGTGRGLAYQAAPIFDHARDLFVEANDGPLAPLHCWLICSCGLPDPPFLARSGTGTGNERQPRERDQGLMTVKAVVRCKEQGAIVGSSLSLSGVVPTPYLALA